MLYFQRKSLSFETALSYLQAFNSNSHAFFWNRSSLFQHFNSLCEVNGVLLHFLNAELLEKITFLLTFLKLLTSIHQQLTCISLKEKQSVPTLQFTVQVNGVLLHFLNAVLSEKITFFESALSYLQAFTRNSNAFLWKRSSLFQHFNSLYEVSGVLLHFLNAVLLEKITFLWKCLKLLTSIHQKLTCISLKEKQSVPTLKFTVQSEWSVASLSKCCPVRENHFPLKVP